MPDSSRGIALSDKVRALRNPACYPDPAQAVQAIETHMSWVFLTDDFAYKLKKPVHYAGQDFRTLGARGFYCREELRLNRRLAAPVYLDVVPLAACGAGGIRIGGPGRTVDWLVRMRRLPSPMMLDALLARGAATPAQMQSIAVRIATFHRAQPPAPVSGPQYRALLMRHIAEYERELVNPAWGLPAARVAALCTQQRAVLQACAACIDQRVAAGRVVEGHGDLRPEHVHLGEPLAIIDCLEFSRELRLQDGIDEIGFLALECEKAHAAPLAAVLLQAYRDACGDRAPQALLQFHQSCRACGRARLAIRHLLEPRYHASPLWRQRTLRYLALAARHLRHCEAKPAPAAP